MPRSRGAGGGIQGMRTLTGDSLNIPSRAGVVDLGVAKQAEPLELRVIRDQVIR